MLSAHFEQALTDGDLPQGADPSVLARTVMTAVHGLAVQAVSGASADDLHRVALTITLGWTALVDAGRRVN